MRKIEENMCNAIDCGQPWSGGNTMVTPRQRINGDTVCSVFLHGHHIADVEFTASGRVIDVNIETLRRWPTVTTKSRLRALGVDLFQKDFEIFIDGRAVCYA